MLLLLLVLPPLVGPTELLLLVLLLVLPLLEPPGLLVLLLPPLKTQNCNTRGTADRATAGCAASTNDVAASTAATAGRAAAGLSASTVLWAAAATASTVAMPVRQDFCCAAVASAASSEH